MTIRHRITLLVVLTFLALSAIGVYAVVQTRKSASEVRQVTQGIVPSALASADLVSDVKNIQIATMTLIYAPDANTAAQARDELKAKQAALRAALDAQAKSAASHAQEGLVSQAKDSATNYFAAIDDTVKMKADGKTEMAQAYLFANVAQYRDELESIVDTLRVEKNRQKDDAIRALNGMLATTATAIAGVAGTVIVLLTALGFVLYRQITRPLSRMQTMMSEIATSQDFTRRVPVGRMDEIGHSIVAFNGMIEKIQENSAQLKQKTADIQAMHAEHAAGHPDRRRRRGRACGILGLPRDDLRDAGHRRPRHDGARVRRFEPRLRCARAGRRRRSCVPRRGQHELRIQRTPARQRSRETHAGRPREVARPELVGDHRRD